jgi:pilus assembly protein CpaE
MAPDHPTPSSSHRAVESGGAAAGTGRVIAVYGARGNVGVSTIAGSLAAAFQSMTPAPVALVALDPRALRGGYDLAESAPTALHARSTGTSAAMQDQLAIPGTDDAGLVRRSDGIWTIAPARRRTPAPSDAKAVTAALEMMRSAFGISVVDLEHQVNERTLAAFDAADRIVMVTEGSVPSLRGTQRVLRLCRRLNYPDEKMCVVANRYDAAGALAVADIATILKREVLWKVPVTPSVDLAPLAARLRD